MAFPVRCVERMHPWLTLLLYCTAEPVGMQEGEKEPELPLWEADWDDEDVGGDFVQQLKAELGRSAPK